MFRVMVVDDEPLILAGVISMINWKEHKCKIVGRATNGKDALKKIEELQVDIVITDIKMPTMGGIELITNAKEQGLDSLFIVLTNLEEFILVKQAMSLGAIDYLVKLELTEEILLESLKKAIDVCKNNRKLKLSYKDNKETNITGDDMILNYFQKLLIYDVNNNEAKDIPNYIIEKFQEPVVIMINFNYKEQTLFIKVDKIEQRRIIEYAENILNEMIKRFFSNSCLLRGHENTFISILSTYEVKDYANIIRNMGEKIKSILKDYFEVSVTISVSKKGNSICDVADLVYMADTAMNYYYYDASTEIIFYSEKLEEYEQNSKSINISSLKKELNIAIRNNDSIKVSEIIDRFILMLKEEKPCKVYAINLCSNLYYFVSLFYEEDDEAKVIYETNINEVLQGCRSLDNIIDWIIEFSSNVVEVINNKKVNKSNKIIEMVEQYVKQNYKEKIGLSKVASDFNISHGYLSSTFKKQTGVTFSDYVASVKIDKAKELISTHEYMMYEVSDILGFDNPYYFSKVFKKITGYTPKEYEVIELRKSGKCLN